MMDTITEKLEAIAQQMRDEYCRWPRICECEDELIEEHCEMCPLVTML